MTRKKRRDRRSGISPPPKPPHQPHQPSRKRPVSTPPPRPVPPAPRWEDVQHLPLKEGAARILSAWQELKDCRDEAECVGAFDGLVWGADHAKEVGEQMYRQGYLERQRLEVEARLADPALSERLRRRWVGERAAGRDESPSLDRLLLQPGKAPRLAAGDEEA